MMSALTRHDLLLKDAVESNRGRIIKTTGDGLHAVFEDPDDGISAALAGQQAIATETWPVEIAPLMVRMGLHSGKSQERDGDYYGSEVNRAARVMGLGYGGQVLLSEMIASLIKRSIPKECSLTDLGEHRLKGIAVLERIFQLSHTELAAEFPPLKSLATFKHNLPRQLSTFIGREKELAEVMDLLKETHHITLVGPGGTGKTRLMVQAAEEVIDDFSDGVWLIEFAPLTDPTLIFERVAATLNIQEQPGRELSETLVEDLRSKDLLLLLDNAEHLVRESAAFTEYLLKYCPKLKILVTSREALFIEGETTLVVPSLSIPEPGVDITFEEAFTSDGVQLFLERARTIRTEFTLTANNANTITEIVRQLDGIPLAIELAAARTRMMTVDQINARLNDRFRLLTGGRRTALPRQQTLQALFDWSWNLLDQLEQVLLCRLSIFSNGWTLEAAQSVAGITLLDEFGVFEKLEQLVNKSLVIVEYPPGSEARYGMLESIRQYASARLHEAGEDILVGNQHYKYFLSYADAGKSRFAISEDEKWLNRIQSDLDNIRNAWDWTLEREIIAPLYQFTVALARFLYNRGNWRESTDRMGRALMFESDDLQRERGFLMNLRGTILGRSGKLQDSEMMVQKTYALGKQLDDPYLLTMALLNMGQSAPTPERRARLGQEAILHSRKMEDPSWLAGALVLWGNEMRIVGNMQEARAAIEESLDIFQNLSNSTPFALAIINHGWLELDIGNLARARQIFTEAVEICRRNANLELAQSLLALAMVSFYEEKYEEARRHLEEALSLAKEVRIAHIIPTIFAWVAHLEISESRLHQAGESIRESFEGYLNFYSVDEGTIEKRESIITADESTLSIRPDFQELLIAAARLAAARKNSKKAVEYLGYCEKIKLDRKFHLDSSLQKIAVRLRNRLQTELGDVNFSIHWEKGMLTTFFEIIQESQAHKE
jgi:predicted ATPase